MNKWLKRFSIAFLPVFLSSCSNANVKDINIKNYGNSDVPQDVCLAKMQARFTELFSSYFVTDSSKNISSLTKNLIVESYYYEIRTFDSNIKDNNSTRYYEKSEKILIDGTYKRFTRNSSSKTYSDSKTTGKKREVTSEDYYGEIVNNILYLVDLSNDTISTSSYGNSYFPYDLSSIANYSRNITGSYYTTKYYLADNVFTLVGHTNDEVEIIVQFDLTDSIILKSISKTMEVVSSGVVKVKSGIEIRIEQTSKGVQAYDYSNLNSSSQTSSSQSKNN